MLKVHVLKVADRWLGRMLAYLLPKPSPPSLAAIPPSSILLIRPGGIGDAVHLVPAIRALQQHFPGAAIDILAERRNAGVFALCPGTRQLYLYDRPGQFLKVLRRRYDVVIDTEQWHRLSAVAARMIKSSIKIGYATNERDGLFNCTVSYSQDDYEVASFLHLLEPLGISASAANMETWLQVPASALQAVARLLPNEDARTLVVFFPGASIAERRWGTERFRAAAQWCGEKGFLAVVVGGEGERAEGEHIALGLDKVVNLAGRTSLAETAAVLMRAAVVVSGDSGILHIAVGLGRPTVSLFGPGIVAKWAPRGSRHIVLNKPLFCAPCTRFGYTPPCPTEARCMKNIAVTDVVDAIDILLGSPVEQERL